MTAHRMPSNPSSIKTKFAHGLVGALKRLNTHRPTSAMEIYNRYRIVKIAADASMASAVGPDRAWSRAVLRRMRRHALPRTATALPLAKARLRGRGRREKRGKGYRFRQTTELRRLVPGGRAMDLHTLLLETAHYIKCLTTQVQVMRNIVDVCSA